MAPFILILKIVGLFLSAANFVGTERLRKWEDGIRFKLGDQNIKLWAEIIWQKTGRFLDAPSLLAFKGLSLVLLYGLILGLFLGFRYVFSHLLSFIASSDLLAVLLIICAVLCSMSPLLLLVFYIVMWLIGKSEESRLMEFTDSIMDISKYVFLLVLSPFILLLFAMQGIEEFLIPWIIARMLMLARIITEAIIKVVRMPYFLIDKQVQKRHLESTIVVIGLLIAAFSEIAGYLIKK